MRDAAAAGDPAIWELNTAIDTAGTADGVTIQLKLGAPGDSLADYEIAPATLGVAQSIPVAPPAAGRITAIGFVDEQTMFIEFEFEAGGSMKVTESEDLTAFTEVSARTQINRINANRCEFQIPSGAERFFFRIEEG